MNYRYVRDLELAEGWVATALAAEPLVQRRRQSWAICLRYKESCSFVTTDLQNFRSWALRARLFSPRPYILPWP